MDPNKNVSQADINSVRAQLLTTTTKQPQGRFPKPKTSWMICTDPPCDVTTTTTKAPKEQTFSPPIIFAPTIHYGAFPSPNGQPAFTLPGLPSADQLQPNQQPIVDFSALPNVQQLPPISSDQFHPYITTDQLPPNVVPFNLYPGQLPGQYSAYPGPSYGPPPGYLPQYVQPSYPQYDPNQPQYALAEAPTIEKKLESINYVRMPRYGPVGPKVVGYEPIIEYGEAIDETAPQSKPQSSDPMAPNGEKAMEEDETVYLEYGHMKYPVEFLPIFQYPDGEYAVPVQSEEGYGVLDALIPDSTTEPAKKKQ